MIYLEASKIFRKEAFLRSFSFWSRTFGSFSTETNENMADKHKKAHHSKYKGEKKEYDTAHYFPAKMLKEIGVESDEKNYRNTSVHRNRGVDNTIDNMVFQGFFEPKTTSKGVYVSKQMGVDRVEHQLDFLKRNELQGENKVMVRKMYKAAQDMDMDLRAFNGFEFARPKKK